MVNLLKVADRKRLEQALNANHEWNEALIMDETTSFIGSGEVVEDEEVINAIRSCPTHY